MQLQSKKKSLSMTLHTRRRCTLYQQLVDSGWSLQRNEAGKAWLIKWLRYGLDNRGIVVRYPERATVFSDVPSVRVWESDSLFS